jgi:hypothetical protein
MEFHSLVPPLDMSPLGSLTIPQFMLDATPEVDGLGLRPVRDGASATWFVEDETGRRYDLETVRQRVYGLANALAGVWGVREGDVGALCYSMALMTCAGIDISGTHTATC